MECGKNKHSKKCKYKCCCNPIVKRLPYASISTPTESITPVIGSTFLIPPNTAVGLWQNVRPTNSPTGPGQTCLNGTLKSWFNVADGKFTYQEAGVYEVTFTGFIVGQIPTGTTGTVYMGIEGFMKDVGAGRCQKPGIFGGTTNPLNPTNFFVGGPPFTVSGVRPNISGDSLGFAVYLDTPMLSSPLEMLFEIDVVQLSRLNPAKTFEITTVTES